MSVPSPSDPIDWSHDLALAIELLERFGGEALELWLRRRGPGAEALGERLKALLDGGLLEVSPPQSDVEHIDHYRVVGRIGAGAVGVVYLAVDDELERLVAIKRLAVDLSGDERLRERFRREARALAALRGPGCVRVLGVGEAEGRPHIVMEFVQGTSLAEGLDRLRAGDEGEAGAERLESWRSAFGLPSDVTLEWPPARLAVHWIRQVAEACVEAHGLGILHRDIKPSNVLIDDTGHARLLDFGLAQLRDDANLTWSREIVGTPRYMAPELIRGGAAKADSRADVHALGACLYELLTLAPAFDAPSAAQVMGQVLERDVELPSHRNARVPRDLDAIVVVAMAKEPEKRYLDARALADDLARFLAGEMPLARVPSPFARLVRTARRRPLLSGLAATVGLLATATVLVVLIYGDRLRVRSEQALVAGQAAESALTFLEEVLELSDVEELGPDVPALRLLNEGATRVRNEAAWGADSVVRPRLARLLGALQWGAGELSAAQELLELSTTLLERPTPEGHDPEAWRFEQALAINYLGNVQRARGMDAEAERTYRRALASIEGREGERWRDQESTICANLSDLLGRSGAYEEAQQLARRGLELCSGEGEEARANRAWGLVALARIQCQAKDLGAAAASIEEAHQLVPSMVGRPLQQATLLDATASLAFLMGELERAQSLYSESVAVYERTLGPDALETAKQLVVLGSILEKAENWEGARAALTRAQKGLEAAGDDGAAHLRQNHVIFGLVEARLGNPAAAREHLEASETADHPLGANMDDLSALRVRLALAAALAQTGDLERSQARLASAVEAMAPDFRTNRYPVAVRNLAEACIARTQGDLAGARQALERARRELADASARLGSADIPRWLTLDVEAEQRAQTDGAALDTAVGNSDGK